MAFTYLHAQCIMQSYVYRGSQLGLIKGKVAVLKEGLAYGRRFLAGCVESYSFIHCHDMELLTMNSEDPVETEDADDNLGVVNS